ncbi:MAG: WhiB family transcriptional regulator [Acidimicrobiales bacterium]
MTALEIIDLDSPPRPWWMENAACRGKSDLFFPPPGERPAARENRENRARQVCIACPVLSSCQDFARDQRELGFWGGESEIERAEAGFAPTTPVIGLRRHRTGQPV